MEMWFFYFWGGLKFIKLIFFYCHLLYLFLFQMLINIYCNEKMDFTDNICCKGPPKATKVQNFLISLLGLV
jgi:hypothetical protein